MRRFGYKLAHTKLMGFACKVKIMVHEVNVVALIGLTFALITISSYHLYVQIYAHKCTCLYCNVYMYMNTSTMWHE